MKRAVVTPIDPLPAPAGGPFAGVPFLVKDPFLDVADTRLTAGSRWLAGNVSVHDQELGASLPQGNPAMSVPFGFDTAGLPVSVHLLGRFGAEATLFRLARQLEQTRPWAHQVPAAAPSRNDCMPESASRLTRRERAGVALMPAGRAGLSAVPG